MREKRTLCKVQNTHTQNIKKKRSTYMWKKAHPNTELRVQSVHIMHVETSWQTMERNLPVMVDVLQGMRPTAKVLVMTGTQNTSKSEATNKKFNYQVPRTLQWNWMRPKERELSLSGWILPSSYSAWKGKVAYFGVIDANTMPK